jgi:putative ABC transport system permease protein
MFKSQMKTAWRSAVRHKAFSAINVAGLAIGMACCLLIMFWVQDELSYDRFHANAGRIFRIVSDWTKNGWNGIEGTPAPLAPAVQSELPEIEKAARFATQNRMVFRYKDKTFYESRGIIVDPSFFDIFSFPLIQGRWETALSGPADMVVTRALAEKYFGTEDPIGKAIDVDGQPRIVRGVLRDIPRNSTFQFDFASSFAFIGQLSEYASHWGAFNFSTIILLKNGADPAAVGPKITGVGLSHKSPQVEHGVRFRLQPLAGVHLDARPYQMAAVDLGDLKSVYLFSVIAVFVLFVACINFMNLATARSGLRAREVGMRKTVGASRREIIRQFFGESFLLVGAAAAIALALARVLLPAFNRLSGKALRLDLLRPEYAVGFAAVILITGLLAGLYPAVFLSGFAPVQVLRGAFSSGRKGAVVRKILVIFQFTLSVLLLVMTVVLSRQFWGMRTADLGFDRENVVQIPVKENIGKEYKAAKARLAGHSAVLVVTAQAYPFAETTWRSSGNFDWEGRAPDQTIDLVYAGVDIGYFEALGIPILEGRAFSKDRPTDAGQAFILNEEAVRRMGLKDPVGKRFSVSREQKGLIVGVARNTQFQSFRFKEEPRLFYVSDMAEANDMGIILVKIDGARSPEALAHIRSVWEEFNPISPFEFRFLDEVYEGLYRSESRMNRVFNGFAGLAVFIACLGLLGLASFTVERRTKEIGIRRVLGASSRSVAKLIAGQLTKWVLAANLIAWPAAYLILNKLLQVYTFRTKMNFLVFALPSFAVFGLAWLTVAVLALKTTRANPAESLRFE